MEKKYRLYFKGKTFGCAITAADVKKITVQQITQSEIDKVLIDFTKSMAKQMAKGE